jgi:inorganic pyrophosphatase
MDLHDIRPHALREIEHFFQVYKDLEGTRTESRGFKDRTAAAVLIRQAMAAYDAAYPGSSRG